MRAWKSRPPSPANATSTIIASVDSANPGTLAGNASEASMPRGNGSGRPEAPTAIWPATPAARVAVHAPARKGRPSMFPRQRRPGIVGRRGMATLPQGVLPQGVLAQEGAGAGGAGAGLIGSSGGIRRPPMACLTPRSVLAVCARRRASGRAFLRAPRRPSLRCGCVPRCRARRRRSCRPRSCRSARRR